MAINGNRDLEGAGGLGGIEATEPSLKRGPIQCGSAIVFNKKPHSRSAWPQTLRPSLIRRFALRGDPNKFACPSPLLSPKARRVEACCAILRCEAGPIQRYRARELQKVMAVTDIPRRF